MSQLPLEGKVALVTGAAKRTGRTIALALAEAGADLVIHYNASADAAEEVVGEVERRGRRALALSADLGDAAATETAFQQAAHTLGGLHILVNNACGILWKRLDATTAAEWHWAVEQTLHITFHACQAALPTMRQQGFGRIVNPHPGRHRGPTRHHGQWGLPRHPGQLRAQTAPGAHPRRPLRHRRGGGPGGAVSGRPGQRLHHRHQHQGERRLSDLSGCGGRRPTHTPRPKCPSPLLGYGIGIPPMGGARL
jgi:hypothetical protein